MPSLRARITRVAGAQAMASVQNAVVVAAGRLGLEDRVDPEVRPRQAGVEVADGADALLALIGVGEPRAHRPVEVRAHDLGALGIGVVGVEHGVGRVGQGEHDRALGAQHPVHLAEDAGRGRRRWPGRTRSGQRRSSPARTNGSSARSLWCSSTFTSACSTLLRAVSMRCSDGSTAITPRPARAMAIGLRRRTAAELQHPLVGQVAEQPVRRLVGDVGPVLRWHRWAGQRSAG